MKRLLISCTIALTALVTNAQNPYLPLWEFIPDGEPYVFEDPDNAGKYRVYVYGSHDNLINKYCGKDQVVWSASVDDLTRWRCDGVIFESKTDAKGKPLYADGDRDILYAPDVVEATEANGKKCYYLYPNVQHSDRNSLVAKSDRPDGPFKVCNWDPENPRKTVGPFGFDPAAFIDDDGRAYGYWGFKESFAAELDRSTMATVKPGTEIVKYMIPGYQQDNKYRFFEASSIRKIKDKYVFIYSRWTNPGEEGLGETNYTLAYCYSNHPLGPWTYGGTIIDGRGKERQEDGSMKVTATISGNTHGSICEINGRWWVFYHRQADTNEYCRQAMVAPINIDVQEGEDGYVKISEAEFTSEGFQIQGLDPYTRYSAGIACYFSQPDGTHQEYPNVVYSGPHTQVIRNQYPGSGDPYALEYNKCPMVNCTDGSAIGYKYFNYSKTYRQSGLKLSLNCEYDQTEGTIEVYIDRPSEAEGGVKLGETAIKAGQNGNVIIPVENLKYYNGKHALFFTFKGSEHGKSICKVHDFAITK